MVSVLIDLSVRREAVLTQEAKIEKEILWGDKKHAISITTSERRPNASPHEVWRRLQKECLPAVAHFARQGVLSCYSYSELKFEEIRGYPGMMGTTGDLFAGVGISNCSAPIERSRFQQTVDFSSHVQKGALNRFCEFLLAIEPSFLMQVPEIWNSLSTFEKENVTQLDRFKYLCRRLAKIIILMHFIFGRPKRTGSIIF